MIHETRRGDTRTPGWLLHAFLASLVVGCSGGTADTEADGAGGSANEGAAGTSGGAGVGGESQGWKTLLEGGWTLPPGTEDYACVRQTIDEDIYVTEFEAINPLGTHHTVLTMGAPSGPDGVADCSPGENHTLALFGSGVGTNPFAFPEGVAVKIEAGTQLLLNLHLFNTADEELTGVSGTRYRAIAESEVDHLAEGVLAGTFSVSLPPLQESTLTGFCDIQHDVTLISVAPHMHQLGTHMKVVAERGNEEITLHDADYSFEEQVYYSIDPIELSTGDRVRVECTYMNTTSETVTFGESTLDEMCFSGVYWYPAADSFFVCAEGLPALPP